MKEKHISGKQSPPSLTAQVAALAIPIALQSLINAAINAADVMMIGQVSQNALSAVSAAGQVFFVLQLFYMGLVSGLSVLSSQYWGKGDRAAVERVLGIAVSLGVFVSVIFFLLSEVIPGGLLKIFTADEALIQLGIGYLRLLAPSFLLMGVSQMLLGVMKSTGRVSRSTLISVLSLLLNVVLNAVAIFLIFPGNEKGAVCGIAVSTLTARAVELICCLADSMKKENVRIHRQYIVHPDAELLHDYTVCTLPVQLNFLIWGGGLSAASAITGHVSSDLIAASAVASTVKNLAVVVCSGISGSSILVGQQLGRGDLKGAEKTGRYLTTAAVLFGVLAGLGILIARPAAVKMAALTPEAEQMLSRMLLICAVYCIGKSVNSTLVGGIFCAGGDTKFGLFCDAVAMWVVMIPLGALAAFVWKWDPVWVYAVLSMDELIKMPVVFWRYSRKKWLKNITRDTAAA